MPLHASSNLSVSRSQQIDAKPGPDPHQDQFDRLRDFGFNEQEARFLYLAATHSGYFTRHQFLSFTHKTKGCLVHRFTTTLLTQHHAQAIQYGHKTYVFKLTSRKIYDLIGKQDLRDHRSHTGDFIRRRLLVLDFVLAHPDLQYLESQEEKIKFFHEQLGIPASLFLGQTDSESLDLSLNGFFKDRFPLFVSSGSGNAPASALPTFDLRPPERRRGVGPGAISPEKSKVVSGQGESSGGSARVLPELKPKRCYSSANPP